MRNLILILFLTTSVCAGGLSMYGHSDGNIHILDTWKRIVERSIYDVNIHFINEDFNMSWTNLHLIADTKTEGDINFVIDVKSKKIMYSTPESHKNFECRKTLIKLILGNEEYDINIFDKILYELNIFVLYPCNSIDVLLNMI